MAETAASALLGVIFERLTDEALKKFARSQNIHSELDELQSSLRQIEALLNDASRKETTNESVRLWLNSLKHLAYDIDDVLDEVATAAMHRELTLESGALTSKVRKAIPTCCINLSLSQSLLQRLDDITTKLEKLEKQKGALGLVVNDANKKDSNNKRGNETSLLESDVVGREGEKEKLLNKLLGGESSKENFSIVPIVGMGGVGKTTLARLLYNDTKVEAHFKLKGWVCVSDDFDIFKISETIFRSVTREYKEFKDLNELQVALKEQLNEKRFLLVVDDVWSENYDDWEILVRPFHSCAPGSMIIMTTRKEQLLKTLGFDHLDHLESLLDKDALSLLALHALGVGNFDSHPTLIPKGEGIVGKCSGLPLALKAIGRLLRTKTDEEDWDDVLNSEIWDLDNGNEIVPALRLSYHDLSPELRQLFAYCSMFPKDFLFDKKDLILLWMAEGYLNLSPTNKPPERLGLEYFEKLLSRSFFQYAPNDKSFFVMHDLMNDLATFVAGEYFLRFDKQMEVEEEALAKYRHMSFLREEYVAFQKFVPFDKARNLRTLLAVYVGVEQSPYSFYLSNKILAVYVGVEQSPYSFYLSNKILADLIPRLPLLRVLSLSLFGISELPDFIGSLKHLRYLNLSQTKIRELPETFGNLYNLQTLIVSGCQSLTKLPKSFLKLQNLRHFDIRDTPLLKILPLGISELRSLRTLSKIIIGGDSGFKITELKGLPNLHGEISIEGLDKVQSALHAREANLSLRRLTKFELKWSDGTGRGALEKEILNELKPHTDKLKSFGVEYYGGIEFPGWVGDRSFRELVYVSIRGCRKCTSLPPLGQLPSLKELFIQGMDEVKAIGSELAGTNSVAFPSLEILKFEDMSSWQVWLTNSKDLDAVFQCLRELHIINCPKLREVSLKALPSLRVLQIEICGEGVLRSLLKAGSVSLITKLKIKSISGLTDEVWRGATNYLGAVEEVTVWGCNEIRYLWESEAYASKVLVSLKELSVNDCENLVSLGEKDEEDNFRSNVLSSLKRLKVSGCAKVEHCRCPNNIERLDISFCKSLTRVSFTRGVGQKLKELNILECGEITEKINYRSMPILEVLDITGWRNLKSIIQLSNFIHLTTLIIEKCPSIESFPDIQLLNLTRLVIISCQNLKSIPDLQLMNLTTLIIENCQNLRSIPDLQMMNLTLLNYLEIRDCPSIDGSFPRGHWPPKLRKLEIGGFKKPILEWGFQNFPTSLVNLSLFDEPHVSNFRQLADLLPSSLTSLCIYNFPELKSLSEGLQHLISLHHLRIINCPNMKRLPKMLLPSLLRLLITECPKLKQRCTGRGSHYWPLISHIPCIDID